MATPEWSDWSGEEPAPERWRVPAVSSYGWTSTELRTDEALPSADDLHRWILSGPAPADDEGPTPRRKNPRRLKPLNASASMPNLPPRSFQGGPPDAASGGPKRGLAALGLLRNAGKKVVAQRRERKEKEHWLAPMAEHGRAQQLRERLHLEHATMRVPTPQYAARRDMPPPFRMNPRVPSEAPASHGWQPADAAEKLGDDYMFHEPGEEVRSNLEQLEAWRRFWARARAPSRRYH